MSRKDLPAKASRERPIKIAILAMGGEGGGVLADWIVDAAESSGYYAQSTSVPGVAQRTGATIYYVEVLPVKRDPSRAPVLSLMPTPGDVDVVIASELMESARAVQRGLVTTDKTLLIASSHRVYAMPEKMAMGDGRVSSEQLLQTGRDAARQFVPRDFASLAERSGSVISAALFGALAAAAVLPWERGDFEQSIERGGVGVATSLAAFAAGFDAFLKESPEAMQASKPDGSPSRDARLQAQLLRARREFSSEVIEIVEHGVRRCADYQDVDYAATYLDRLAPVSQIDEKIQAGGWRLTRETARYLALWMTYEDTARVAELKLRGSRFQRVRREVRAAPQQLVRINEYFHPRLQEVADTLPAGLGRGLLTNRVASSLLGALTKEGRIVRTTSLSGFLLLYAIASCRKFRRRSLRYERETAAMKTWLSRLARTVTEDYDLACEVVECQRLIKGYGDTHARGTASYEAIMSVVDKRALRSAELVRELRESALADESGEKLSQLLAAKAPS